MARSTKPIGAKLVDGLKPEPGRDMFLWDCQIPGFGVRVKPTGTKAYISSVPQQIRPPTPPRHW